MTNLEDMEIVDLSKVTVESKIALLEELGFGTDGSYVTRDGKHWKDRYTDKLILLNKMAIFPGKQGEVIIIEDDVFSLIYYLEEFENEV